jgi:hypothetical protein
VSAPAVVNEARSHHVGLWRVAIVDDVNMLPDSRKDAVIAWLQSYGIPTQECAPRLVVTQSEVDGKFRAHVTVYARDDQGAKYIDHAANRVHTEPLVVTVDSYPDWLPMAGLAPAREQE